MALIGLVLAAALGAAAADVPAKGADVQAAAPAAGEKKPAKPPKPKLVCVEDPKMGSLFKQRICATEAEWAKRRDRDAEMLSRAGSNNGESR